MKNYAIFNYRTFRFSTVLRNDTQVAMKKGSAIADLEGFLKFKGNFSKYWLQFQNTSSF